MKRRLTSLLRLGFTLALVFLAFFVLVQVLAHITWGLSGADKVAQPVSKASSEPPWRSYETKGLHSVAEWPDGRARLFNEAPHLHDRVESGELPPVSQRLPEDPLVIVPGEQCGPYGGSWRRYATGPGDMGITPVRLCYDGLVRFGPTGKRILPNLASRWSVEDDGRTFVFWLRKGIRWSDGAPFTADDVVFWYDHILLHSDITAVIPRQYKRGGEVMRLEKIDPYAFRIRFKEPYGLFLNILASGFSEPIVSSPAHYLKEFHPEFASKDQLNTMAKASGFDRWYQLLQDRRDWDNPDHPRLWAWLITDPPPARPAVWERNPYYWKVDPEGNQLPYIDRLVFGIYDVETINLKAMNGEVGMQGRHLDFANYPLFMENRDKGGYRVFHWLDGGDGGNALALNLNHKDPVLRNIFQDKRFRFALSHALNRDELNEACYFGMGKPRQKSPPSFSAYHYPAYEKAYIDYDPEKANRLLDDMGLDRRDKHGVRLRPDGKPLHLYIEVSGAMLYPRLIELVAAYWTSVGVKSEMKLIARQLSTVRRDALLPDVSVWTGAGECIPTLDPRWFFPHNPGSFHALDFARWYMTDGRKGQKPLPDMMRCIEIYDRIEAAADEETHIALFKEIMDINRENLWVIGMVGEVPAIFLVKNSFRNVPEVAIAGWVFRTPGSTAPECYAIEEN